MNPKHLNAALNVAVLWLAVLWLSVGFEPSAHGAVKQPALHVRLPMLAPSLSLSAGGYQTASPIRLALRSENQAEGEISPLQAAPVLTSPAAPALTQEQQAAQLYRRALILQGEGQLAEATALYESILREFPSTQVVGGAAVRLLELRDAAAATSLPGAVPPGASPTSTAPGTPAPANSTALNPAPRALKVNGGRAEFLVTESILSGYAGVLSLFIANNFHSSSVLIPVLSAGLGLGLSYGVTETFPMTTAQAAQFRTLQLLGIMNGVGLAGAMDEQNLSEFGAQSQLIGLGVGTLGAALLYNRLDLSEGQTALVTSSMFWAPYITLMGFSLFGGSNVKSEVLSGAIPMAADLAVAATYLVIRNEGLKLSRGRVALINLGGVLGVALAGGIAVLTQGTGSVQTDSLLLLLGTLGGLAGGYAATQHWDATYNPEVLARSDRPSILAWEDGRLKLGSVTPILTPEARVSRRGDDAVREVGARVQLELFGGRF